MVDFAIQLVVREILQATMFWDITAISLIALWLIPVYVGTSPSLSGLNFLIAYNLVWSSKLWALYTRPYVPEEMKPWIKYLDLTVRLEASRLAR